jgi:hypothetical protein
LQPPPSNEEVADHDADGDVIVSGPGPRGPWQRPGGLVWLFVLAETVALAVAVVVAVHYRAQARGLQHAGPSLVSLTSAPALPQMGTVVLLLPGGTPGTFYDLIGSDCSTASPLPDDVWATGLAGPNGTADLTGYVWTGTAAVRCPRRRGAGRGSLPDAPAA